MAAAAAKVVSLIDDDDAAADTEMTGASADSTPAPAAAKAAKAAAVVLLDDDDEDEDEDEDDYLLPAFASTSKSAKAAASSSSSAGAARMDESGDNACACCGSSHRARDMMTLAVCQHRVGRPCLSKKLASTPADGSALPHCPVKGCGKAIGWIDLRTTLPIELYTTIARNLATNFESFASKTSIPCGQKVGDKAACRHKLQRPKRDKAHVLKVGTEEDALVLQCKGCKSTVCSACGMGFAPAPAGTTHGCAEAVLMRIHSLLARLAHLEEIQRTGTTVKRRKNSAKRATPTNTAWSKGTGYGGAGGVDTGAAKGMDKALDQGKVQNKKIEEVLAMLRSALSRHTNTGIAATVSTTPLAGVASSLCLQYMLYTSKLENLTITFLRNDSLTEIAQEQAPVFHELLSLLMDVCSDVMVLGVFNPDCPLRAEVRAQQRANMQGGPRSGDKRKAAESVDADGEDDDGRPSASVLDLLGKLDTTVRKVEKQYSKSEALATANLDTTKIIPRLQTTYAQIKRALNGMPHKLRFGRAIVLDDSDSEDDDEGADADPKAKLLAEEAKTYPEKLKNWQFRMVKINKSTHHFHTDIAASAHATTLKERMKRIAKEIATLSSSLPLAHSSSIFLRVDEERPDVMKAMIIGPPDTPYANGCFIFDIFLPADYPVRPPKVNLITTGGGAVRFNPNLYRCGKVCLSLLGTWQGPSWDPKHSTLLQVLLSIQSLILVENPFYNEPGFEARTSEPMSKCYNASLRYHTADVAMYRQLKTPDVYFGTAISAHYRAVEQHVRKQCDEWLDLVDKEKHGAGYKYMHEVSLMPPATVKSKINAFLTELTRICTVQSIIID